MFGRRWWAATAASVALLAACGGDDNDDGGSDATGYLASVDAADVNTAVAPLCDRLLTPAQREDLGFGELELSPDSEAFFGGLPKQVSCQWEDDVAADEPSKVLAVLLVAGAEGAAGANDRNVVSAIIVDGGAEERFSVGWTTGGPDSEPSDPALTGADPSPAMQAVLDQLLANR
jgi:hypothetical protein